MRECYTAKRRLVAENGPQDQECLYLSIRLFVCLLHLPLIGLGNFLNKEAVILSQIRITTTTASISEY